MTSLCAASKTFKAELWANLLTNIHSICQMSQVCSKSAFIKKSCHIDTANLKAFPSKYSIQCMISYTM